MKKVNKLYLTLTICLLLGTYASAQQFVSSSTRDISNKHLAEFSENDLMGKVASIEVYLCSENDLIQSCSDTATWNSNPEYVIFIKGENSVKSYSFTSEISLVIYDLLVYSEEYSEENYLYEIVKIILKLLEKKGDINEIRYEQVGDSKYGYWIYYWLHYYVRHEYGYQSFINQNIIYSPVSVLHLYPLQSRNLWNEKIVKWQYATYGRQSHAFNIYPLEDSEKANKYLLLESIFENNTIRYDLILKYKGEYHFYLSMGSFPALVSEFGKLYKGSDFLNIVKGLCLIDMFYR